MTPAPMLFAPIYLDHHASTPCDPRVLEAMLPWFGPRLANAHSTEHKAGRTAEQAVEAARAEIAALIGAEGREILLTSGATEANNLAILGAARFAAAQGPPRGRQIITLATEHPCVQGAVAATASLGFQPVVLPVGRDGLLDPARLADALREPTFLVSIMAVNNETGVIQDLAGLAAMARAAGALFHTDSAQAAGRLPLSVQPVDLLSLSAHKIYGPQGIGALYVRRRPRVRLAPLFAGGGQERGLRPGTLPVALAVGFGTAARLARLEGAADQARIAPLRDALLARLRAAIPDLVVHGSLRHRVAGNLNLSIPGLTARALTDAHPALCLSSGSACSSGADTPSAVLLAMGVAPALARSALRLGLGRTTSQPDLDRAAAAILDCHATLAGALPAGQA